MYTYKNRKTGQVVFTTCRVTGDNWELVAESPPKPEKKPKQPKPKKSRKEGGRGT